MLGDEGLAGHERGGQGSFDLVDPWVGLRTVGGSSPYTIAGRRAYRTGAQTRGLQVLCKDRTCLPRIGFTRQGRAASCLQGVDFRITSLT
jgi:hypothetical protein